MAGKANPCGKMRPVEWEAYHDIECGQWQVNDSDQREIIATGIETEENANVLAAAPAMYEALSQVQAFIKTLVEADVLAYPTKLTGAVKAALAQAEGKQ